MSENHSAQQNGDPNLGPEDVRIEIKLTLVGQKEILAKTEGSVPLFNALTTEARGALAATIETGFQWTVQSAVRKINELILLRSKAAGQQTAPLPAECSTRVPPARADDYPESLPKLPPKPDKPVDQ